MIKRALDALFSKVSARSGAVAAGRDMTGNTINQYFGGDAIRAGLAGNTAVAPHPDTLPAAAAPPPAIPPRPERNIGRDADTVAIVAALLAEATPNTTLVLGGPGLGKTTLTLAVYHDAAIEARFGARRWFVELETATDTAGLEARLLAALGLDPATARLEPAMARLGVEPALLVLDNLETPWEPGGAREATEAVLARLATVPGLRLLASIRGAEAPARPRWTAQHRLQPLDAAAALALFVDIAPDLSEAHPRLVELNAALGGVPLAITLVALEAARAGDLEAVWQRWQRVGSALAQRTGVDPTRLTSLQHSIELSLASPRMGEPGRRLFRLLGQLPSGMARADRMVLLGEDDYAAISALSAVGLAERRGDRIDLLPPARDHARRLHPPLDDDATVWVRYYLALAADLGGRIGRSDGTGVVERLAPEVPNLDAALRMAMRAGELNDTAAAAYGLALLIQFSGQGVVATLVDLAGLLLNASDIAGAAGCIVRLGDIDLARSNHDAAGTRYEQALPLFRQIGNVLGEANCIQSLGDIDLSRSNHVGARARYEQSLRLFRQVGDVLGEANCINGLADINLARSDHEAARQLFEQALPLFHQIGSILGEANCIRSLGDIDFRRSHHAAARERYAQALPLYRQVGNILGEANCLGSLGNIDLRRSDLDAARESYALALPLHRQVGDILGEANCIWSIGDIDLRRSDYDAARQHFEHSLSLYRQVSDTLGEANCTRSLGEIDLRCSNLGGARERYEQALPLYRQAGNILGEANCIRSLGDIDLRHSNLDAARLRYEQASPLFWQVGDILGEANCTYSLGDIDSRRSDYDAAWQQYERASSLYREVGDVLGEANCTRSLGDISCRRSDLDSARERYEQALMLYHRIPDRYGIGFTHWRLARVTVGACRDEHLSRAREAWLSIGRADLVNQWLDGPGALAPG